MSRHVILHPDDLLPILVDLNMQTATVELRADEALIFRSVESIKTKLRAQRRLDRSSNVRRTKRRAALARRKSRAKRTPA